jgi:formylmethanofuran dehydrogenase subunit B
MSERTRLEHVTCLGCGCGCDDLTVSVDTGRIVEVTPVCPIGKAWFGDGVVPGKVLRSGQPVSYDEALNDLAEMLSQSAGRILVYLGLDLTSQAQRAALTLADLLFGTVDTATSDSAAAGILDAQRRGRATATLGEIRNRADVLLFWGVDPAARYPRYLSRYALDPIGTQVPDGRSGRTVLSVSIGKDLGVAKADVALALDPAEELPALSLMRSSLLGRLTGELSSGGLQQAVALVPRLAGARYAVLVHDAESTDERRDPLRAEGLIALTQALNGPTRAALSSLRGGGNRSGAEAVLTWQTGYPFAVDYGRGYPRYVPGDRGLSRLVSGALTTALVVGTPPAGREVTSALGSGGTAVIGPRASEATFSARVAIDTGVAGIHEGGTAYRMDDVPLPLRPALPNPRSTTETLQDLISLVSRRLSRKGA